jgi:hypothetical protein
MLDLLWERVLQTVRLGALNPPLKADEWILPIQFQE